MRRTHIVVCEWDGYSSALFAPDLPATCPLCAKAVLNRLPRWRITITGELTKSDRRFLKSLRIIADVQTS